MPTPDELNTAPELAVLAVLDSALEAAARALYAFYPEVYDDWYQRPRPEPVNSAYRILSRIGKLEIALDRYRKAVLRASPMESGCAAGLDVRSAEDPAAF
jgi:hypothetical protein